MISVSFSFWVVRSMSVRSPFRFFPILFAVFCRFSITAVIPFCQNPLSCLSSVLCYNECSLPKKEYFMKRDLTELKRLARETLTGHYAAPMAGIVITGAISNLLLLPFDLTLNNSASQSVIFYVASFFIVLLSILFSCGLCYMHLKMRRNLSYGMRDIFYFFKSHPDRLLLSYLLLIGLAVLVFLPAIVITVTAVRLEQTVLLWIAIPVFILSALCLLPLLYRYAIVFYLLIDHPEMKPAAAFRESSRLMKGNRMRLFLLHCSFLGWLLLGICSCFIGFLWIEPYFEQTCVSFYFELTGENDALAQKKAAESGSPQTPHFQMYV